MNKKLICMTVQCQGDNYPEHKWSRSFIGVLCQSTPVVSRSKSMQAAIIPQYEFMCAAVDDAIHAKYLAAELDDILQIELGRVDEIEEETEGWLFWMNRNGVRFEGKFNQGEGGQVSLAQFKLAVETYLRFLQDPERKPIEVAFPD